MKIRSITCFQPCLVIDEDDLNSTCAFITAARQAYQAAGYEVQTSRLATTSFANLLDKLHIEGLVQAAQDLERRAGGLGITYLSIGPALPEVPLSYQAIPEICSGTENVFMSGMMSTGDGKISPPAVRKCAEIIRQLSSMTPDGFTNLRFAALANVPAGSPFFPAAYHSGGQPAFALALEAADLAVEALKEAKTLEEARRNLINIMETHAQRLETVSQSLSQVYGLQFTGIDFSLAPFPKFDASIGTALESLGVARFGSAGSLAAAAFVTDSMDRANFHRTGFSGLMLPVLEDATLSLRAAEGTLTVRDLLLFSAVCGTGIDTVPLPGDTSTEELTGLLLDLAALAHRLDKPLTARLMPIPGKRPGDATGFDFAFFANSRVMALDASPLSGLLARDEAFDLRRRPDR